MTEEKPSEFNFKIYLSIILRRKYIVLAVALTVLSIFTWGSFFMPNIYEASSTVFVEKASIIDPLIRGVGVTHNLESELSTLKDGFTSRNIIERVMKKLDLDATAKDPVQYESIIQDIKENLVVKVKTGTDRKTDLFVIAYTSSNPKIASNLVNTLVSEYIEETHGMRRKDVYGAIDFIQNQVLEYKKRLEESDTGIREFREKNPKLIYLNENAILARIETFQASKSNAEIRLKELTKKKENLQKQLTGEEELSAAYMSNDSSPQGRLNYLNNQLVMLTSKFTDNYPEVIKVKNEIEEMKRQISEAKASPQSPGSEAVATNPMTAMMNPIYQKLRQELTDTESEIESLSGRISELSRQQSRNENILGDSKPKEQEQWTKLLRDRMVYQKIYEDLLQKLENAKVSKDLEVTSKSEIFRVIDPAIVPSFPVKPDRIKIILLGFFMGIASGTGAALGLDYLTHSFKDETTIESKLKLRVLATIPRVMTAEDELSGKKFDRKIFTAAAAYLFVIGVVFVAEVVAKYMGIKIINF